LRKAAEEAQAAESGQPKAGEDTMDKIGMTPATVPPWSENHEPPGKR